MVLAWDQPTRVFHWLLVALIVCAWASQEFAEDIGDVTLVWHRWNGLAILTLLVWRLLWGVFGSSTARFATFVGGPRAALDYARTLPSESGRRYLGHNPLGAWVVLAFIALLLVQAGFGLFATDDNDLTGGPLHRLVSEATNNWATGWHHRIFGFVLLPLIALHIAANVLYGLVKKEPLIGAMITGCKPAWPYEDAAEAETVQRPLVRAGLLLVLAAGMVAGTLLALGGRIPG
jgi:cytochrome b